MSADETNDALRLRAGDTNTAPPSSVISRVSAQAGAALLDAAVVAAAFETAALLLHLDTPHLLAQVGIAAPVSILVGCLYACLTFAMGGYRPFWRYASMVDGLALARILGVTVALAASLLFAGQRGWLGQWSAAHMFSLSAGTFVTGSLVAALYVGVQKALPRLLVGRDAAKVEPGRRLLIIGAGEAGAMLATHVRGSRDLPYQVIAFVDDNPAKWGRRLCGYPIVGPISQITQFVEHETIDLIAIAMPSAPAARIGEVLSLCQKSSARLKIVPGLNQLVGDQPYVMDLREVNLVDLLGRDETPLRLSQTAERLSGKRVVVTGAAGSIGAELCRQLLTYHPVTVLALDNNETGLFELAERLHAIPSVDASLRLCVEDISDDVSMRRFFARERPDVVYHAAAYKHVPLLEDHPYQAARVNVLATWRLCRLARELAVERFVFISSDKAADPVNVLGASKRLGELIVHALAREDAAPMTTSFRAVRFGNVIGSRGSVVPSFMRQIETGGPVTLTDPEATRYFMTIPEACSLVITASLFDDAQGLYLLDMGDPVRIADVALKMIRMRGLRPLHDIPITSIGLRPGEKLHETLAAPGERLVPTEHPKILRLAQQAALPEASEIERWMCALDTATQEDTSAPQLRDLLLQYARREGVTRPRSVVS